MLNSGHTESTSRLEGHFGGIFLRIGLVARIDPTGRVYQDPILTMVVTEFGPRPQQNFICENKVFNRFFIVT